MFLPPPVCPFVCFSVRYIIQKYYERIFMKFYGGVWRGPRNGRLGFGGNPDHDTDAEFFKSILYLLLTVDY